MSGLDAILGRPGEPVSCYEQNGIALHWFHSDAQPDDLCICGKMTKKEAKRGREGQGDKDG